MNNLFKKFTSIFLITSMSVAFTAVAKAADNENYVWNEDSKTEIGPINGKYSIGFEKDGWSKIPEVLNDGGYKGSDYIACKQYNNYRTDGVYDDTKHYFDIDFGAKKYAISSLELASPNVNDQGPLSIRIDYWDTAADEWIVGGSDDIYSWTTSDYIDATAEVDYKRYVKIEFNEVYETTKLRVQIRTSNAKYNLFSVCELVPYGVFVNTIKETYNFQYDSEENSQIQADYELGFESEYSSGLLFDGFYNTEISGAGVLSDEKPYIEVSFGDRIFDINSAVFGVDIAKSTENAPSKIKVDYYNSEIKEWVSGEVFQLNFADYTSEIDRKASAEAVFETDIVTNKLRFYVDETINGNDEFVLSELIVLGEFKEITNFFPLDSDYITGFALEKWSTSIGSLEDGDFSGGVACNSVDYVNGVYGDNYHILMTFGGKVAEVKALKIGSNAGSFADQGVLSLRVDWFDTETGEMVVGERHSLSYTDSEDGNKVADVILDNPVKTNILRVQILTSNRTHRLFKLSELKAYGVLTDEYAENQLSAAEISYNGTSITELCDGDFETFSEFKLIGDEQDNSIIIDFGEEKYLNAFEMMIDNTAKYGISDIEVYYELDGEWLLCGEYAFTYDSARATGGTAIVKQESEILSQKIKLVLPDFPDELTAYRINELKVFEEEFSSLEEYEKSLLNLKFKGSFKYYEECIENSSSVPSDKRTEYLEQAEELRLSEEEKQNVNIEYSIPDKKAKISGYVFSQAGEYDLVFTKENGEEIIKTVTVSENGKISEEISFAGDTDAGNTTAKLVVSEGQEISGNEFFVRAPQEGASLLQMSVNGVAVTLNGTTGTLVLPVGSSLTNVIPVFTISEGAKLLYNGEELESGKTTIDLTTTSVFKVEAENPLNSTEYTISVSVIIYTGGSGSSGSGGGGSSSSKNKAQNVLPVAQPDISTQETKGFNDVKEDFWGYDSIMKLYEKGIINGITKNSFEPESPVTRGQFVKMLLGAMGITTDNSKSTFLDVCGHWSEKYVAQAVSKGIIFGVSEDLFGVENNVSRQDAAVMIYRALNENTQAENSEFKDDSLISEYAKNAVYLLKDRGIINGYEDGSFNPLKTLTRAEAAAILAKIID